VVRKRKRCEVKKVVANKNPKNKDSQKKKTSKKTLKQYNKFVNYNYGMCVAQIYKTKGGGVESIKA
jgi:hypothetical protein